MRVRNRLLQALVVVFIGHGALAAPRPPLDGAPVSVSIADGRLTGRGSAGVMAFRGIPYAAPPVGPLRWRPPQPAAPWSGARDSTRFGEHCPQRPLPAALDPGSGQPTSEDCLYLNIWSPLAAGERRPVMVWIHGGRFVLGSGAMAATDGAVLARQGVVVVTFNYRLGRFGFFAHPALTREHPGEPTGNYGIMDQIAALKWVTRNIAAFGGDPANVTIFGESAGGGSVLALMGSPMSRGLFEKAIVESGGGRDRLATLETPSADAPAAYAAGQAFAAKAGLENPDAAALRALPAASVLGDIDFTNSGGRSDYSGMVIDGRVITDNPAGIFARGQESPAPMLIGFNSDELGALRAYTGDWVRREAANFGPREAVLRRTYDPRGGDEGLMADFLSDLIFVEPARFLARSHAKSGHRAFLYEFGYVAAARRAMAGGAGHASEIPFVFDTVGDVDPAAGAEDRAEGALLSRYWTRFAATGDPNGARDATWPAYRAASDTLMDFKPAAAAPLSGRSRERLDFLQQGARAP